MSSYVTSPFVLEERRLQGIVNKCSEDLNIALNNIIVQENLMREKAEEQKQIDRMYFVSQSKVENEYMQTLLERNAELEGKRNQLRTMLQNFELELEIFKNNNYQIDAITERQKQLWYRLENSRGNLDELEKNITLHIQEAEVEIKEQSASNAGRNFNVSENVTIKFGKKGASLQMQKQKQMQVEVRKSPLDEFIAKMNIAFNSQYRNRFPSLIQLKNSFDLQPEYAKVAFAVSNMKIIDEIIKQLEMIDNNDKIASNKREKVILQYKAICELMSETADERLIKDERSTRRLVQLYNELLKKYQEQKKQEYVADAVASVMERHGILFQDSRKSSFGNIMHFSMDNASVDISGTEQNYLVMEVTGEFSGDTPTLNDRRKSVSSAQHLCSLLKNIETELKDEYGIIFGKILTEQPSEATIAMRKIASETGEKKFKDSKKQMIDTI